MRDDPEVRVTLAINLVQHARARSVSVVAYGINQGRYGSIASVSLPVPEKALLRSQSQVLQFVVDNLGEALRG